MSQSGAPAFPLQGRRPQPSVESGEMPHRRPEISASPTPAASRLRQRVGPGDFLDCYAVASDLPARPAAEIVAGFPGWARFLLALRNAAVAPFGLKGAAADAVDRIGPFPVESETAEEVVVGFDDRHLDFRVSVYSEDGRVSMATWVRTHHLGGRIYLNAVLPFHVVIVRNALRRLASASAPR